MRNLFIALILAANLAPSIALARAGTLVRCDMLQTQQGIRYVGTYCVDFQCSYTTTRVFMSYCPYSI
jgi:hypothetical protein